MRKHALSRRIVGVVLSLAMTLSVLATAAPKSQAASDTLLTTYGKALGRSGNCVTLRQLQDSATLNHIKTQYNSITLENEMKPDAILGYSPNLMSQSDAKNQGYYVPSGCKDSYLPKLNFSTIDKVLEICYKNGLGMRAHTLIWHSQTPDWFFRIGYSKNYGYVSQDQMNQRMEYYIKSVMNHVYGGKYGSVVYCWDVVNEYLHATQSGWSAIYGGKTTRPAFVKRAFQYANETLSYYGLTNKVSLFYNDYNTYMEVNDVITMINYINEGKKICNGVGMQSHLSTTYPSVDYYLTALKSFLNAGFEVQITELDATNKGDQNLSDYLYSILKQVMQLKKSGKNITGLTIWGLADDVTWIRGEKPLLFSNIYTPKTAYYGVLQAFKDSGYTTNTGSSNSGSSSSGSTVSGSTINNGWYYIKNVHANKYLQVAGNKGGNGVNVEIGTGSGVKGQKWYVQNLGNGYFTLKNGNGYMLDLQYGENKDGANIQTYQANGATAQQFKAVSTGNRTFGIVTRVSSDKKSLDVYNWGTGDGTNVCQWNYLAGNNQKWIFEATNN